MKPTELMVVLERIKLKVPVPAGVSSSTLLPKLVRTKDVKQLQSEIGRTSSAAPTSITSKKPKLTKCLDTFDLTSLGVGSCCGTGMYLVAGMVAKNIAGPGVTISFMIAAVASIFSGACYAEFGVRVPHTSGSAYMYSYVAVGEFVAFIIGWNMILEYLIGTSACACALSSSFDSLSGGAIGRGISDTLGTIFGKPPDLIAFAITILMTFVMALGASKSVLFNHLLNAINIATWVFVMTAGMFYVDTNTWHEHQGFLPYGWSGVFSGAATCFYAFIGFDIIATTGEEAHNPQKSIPKAIVGSLVIVLIAYVSVSLVLTLVVPYDHINMGSALVQMWSYVNAPKCRAIVAIGATAGLSVAMFGSMFPMPRVIYAMAQDGLIFRQLSQLWDRTNVPGLATIGSGVAAAFVALTMRLEILVEMMSIGTLLAYTLVSTCVLILRYQPHSTSLIELLPPQLRQPPHQQTQQQPTTSTIQHDSQAATTEVLEVNKLTTTTVKRVTRGISDSDDSYNDESPEGYLGRDDQFLVSDRSENKFYGSVHGVPTGPTGQATAFDSMNWNFFTRKINEYSYLCPGFFPWIKPGQATTESGFYVTKLVGIMFGLIFVLDVGVAVGWTSGFAIFVYILLLLSIFVLLLIISRQPQNRFALSFLTPGLPFVPTIAVTVNVYLIFKLSILTLVRFTIWMTLGMLMYFYYGISHSTLEKMDTVDVLELEIDDQRGGQAETSSLEEEKAVWDQSANTSSNHYLGHVTPEPMWSKPITDRKQSLSKHSRSHSPSFNTNINRTTTSPRKPTSTTSTAPSQGSSVNLGNRAGSIFVDETEFPTWED